MLMNILEFKMRPQAAVSVPRIVSDKSGVVVIESSFPFPYPIEDLREMGSLIEVSDMIYRIGRISVIQRDPKTGELVGGTDPRAGGGLGYLP